MPSSTAAGRGSLQALFKGWCRIAATCLLASLLPSAGQADPLGVRDGLPLTVHELDDRELAALRGAGLRAPEVPEPSARRKVILWDEALVESRNAAPRGSFSASGNGSNTMTSRGGY